MAGERSPTGRAWRTAILAGAWLAGCDSGAIGLDAAGEFEKVRLGRALPAEIGRAGRREGLGFALQRSAGKGLSGESRREVVRAILDRDGKAVAVHCLRSWRRKSLFGPEEEKRMFVLEALIVASGGAASRPAEGRGLDETLLSMARSSALRSGPRVSVPAAWDRVAPVLLRQLNQRRAAKGLPPAGRCAECPAELLLVAEMLLESVATDGAEQMDRTVWEELDLAGALARVPGTLPGESDGPIRWERTEMKDREGLTLTLAVPFVARLSEDRHRLSGSFAHLGGGHVRIVLRSEWWKGLAQ